MEPGDSTREVEQRSMWLEFPDHQNVPAFSSNKWGLHFTAKVGWEEVTNSALKNFFSATRIWSWPRNTPLRVGR